MSPPPRRLWVRGGPHAGIALEVEPGDAWVGLYVRRRDQLRSDGATHTPVTRFEAWLCIVPCLPVHVWLDVLRRAT